jgi:hypothetical protein
MRERKIRMATLVMSKGYTIIKSKRNNWRDQGQAAQHKKIN